MFNRIFISTFILIISFFLNVPTSFAHEEELFFPVEIHDGANLSVIECVALAFKHSPIIRRMKYNLDIASSNLGIARAQYFPTFGAGVGFYNENNSNRDFYYNHHREFPNIGVSLNQLVWNFGKTSAYIKMEEFNKIAAEYEFMDSLCNTLFDVKEKYYNLLKTQALYDIAQNNLQVNEYIIKISKKNPDLTTAKVNLNKSKIELLEAFNNLNNAKVDLINAMYLDSIPEYSIKETPTFSYNKLQKNPEELTLKISEKFSPEKFPFARDKAIEIAYDSSPDLRALEATKNAMEQALLNIKRTYMPDLTANVGYGYNNTNTQSANNTLQVGVNLSSAVNGMELKHSIKGAEAQVSLADNEIKLFKKDLYYELQRAFNNVDKTEKSIQVSMLNTHQATENFKIIKDKYIANEIDYTSLQDARMDYIQANKQYIYDLYDYNIALIQLEQTMHYHLVDIHHRTEHAVAHHSEELIKHLNEVLGCDEYETGKKLKFRKIKESL